MVEMSFLFKENSWLLFPMASASLTMSQTTYSRIPSLTYIHTLVLVKKITNSSWKLKVISTIFGWGCVPAVGWSRPSWRVDIRSLLSWLATSLIVCSILSMGITLSAVTLPCASFTAINLLKMYFTCGWKIKYLFNMIYTNTSRDIMDIPTRYTCCGVSHWLGEKSGFPSGPLALFSSSAALNSKSEFEKSFTGKKQ